MKIVLEQIEKRLRNIEAAVSSENKTSGQTEVLISNMYSYSMDYPGQKEIIKDMAEYILYKTESSVLSKQLEWLISELSHQERTI